MKKYPHQNKFQNNPKNEGKMHNNTTDICSTLAYFSTKGTKLPTTNPNAMQTFQKFRSQIKTELLYYCSLLYLLLKVI